VTIDRIVGTLAGKAGSFVLQGSGTYSATAGEAKWRAFVVPGSATGDLRGLRGNAEWVRDLEVDSRPPCLPVILEFATELAAAEGDDGIGSPYGPEHPRLFEAADDGFASGFDYS